MFIAVLRPLQLVSALGFETDRRHQSRKKQKHEAGDEGTLCTLIAEDAPADGRPCCDCELNRSG